MKVILATADSQFIHSNLAVRYLKKHTKHIECEVKILETTVNDDPENFLERIVIENPDLVVFSCYIWNITYLKKIMGNLKIVLPQCLIAAGGPEVAYNPEGFLNDSECDLVMETEGEEVFPELLSELLKDSTTSFDTVKGLYIKSNNSIKYTGDRGPLDFDKVVFPYSKEDIDGLDNRIVYYEAQRGCPFRCSYCLSSIDKRLRKHDLERVKNELDFFLENRVDLVKFVDRTFNADEEYSFNIWSHILNKALEIYPKDNVGTCFHFEVEAGLLSERQLELLCSVPKGLIQIEAGIQSTDPTVLLNINRDDRFDKASVNLKRVIEAGRVHVHTDLIVGLPGDSYDKIVTSFNDCMELKPDMLQLGFLKVLHGTPITKVLGEFQIKYRAYPPYEVLSTRDLSFRKISQFKKDDEIVSKYWNSNKFHTSMRYLLTKYEAPFDLFTDIHRIYAEWRIKKENLSIVDYYSLLLDLSKVLDTESSEILAEMVRFDFVINNRKGYIPDTLASEKYNSIKGEIILDHKRAEKLKGTVTGYRIDVLEFFSHSFLKHEETYIFISLNDRNIYKVRQNKHKQFEVIDSINP
ncbi:MAG: DUF4080 domain-containing protein [Clostridiaceae bacterium]